MQRLDEVVEERVAGREAQDEPSAGAADGAGDGDEAEAEPLRVAGAFALGQREQFQPGEQVEGEQRAEQDGTIEGGVRSSIRPPASVFDRPTAPRARFTSR